MTSAVRLPLQSQDSNIPIEEVILQQKSDSINKENTSSIPHKENDNANHDLPYFRNILEVERNKLMNCCEQWSLYQSNLCDIENMDLVTGDIRSVIGKAHLVMDERFSQFEGLIDNSEFGTSEKPVTCVDLQGFWDMIYFQVIDINESFDKLEKRKLNNWKVDSTVTVKPKKVVIKSKNRRSGDKAAATARREAAKKRLAAAKAALKKDKESSISFDAGFFKVNSPARVVAVDKAKTPSSIIRKKVITPSSGNFMHGRTERRITRSSKKTLKFDDASVQKLHQSKKRRSNEPTNDVASSQDPALSSTEASENKENLRPSLNTVVKTPLRSIAVDTNKSVAVMTGHKKQGRQLYIRMFLEPYNLCVFGAAIETMFKQVKIISTVQEELTSNQSPERKIHLLEEENSSLRSNLVKQKQSNVEEQSNFDLPSECGGDHPYNVHYMRLLEKCKVLQAELSAYERLQLSLEASKEKWKTTFDFFFIKSKRLEEFQEKLQERSDKIEEKEKLENEELKLLQSSNRKLHEEIEELRKKEDEHRLLMNEKDNLEKEHKQLQGDYSILKENCELIRKERNDLRENFTRQCDEFETVQKNFQTASEERLFEQEEFANDKAFFEEEKKLLQSQLSATEDTLRSTMDVLQKTKETAVNSQAEVDSLKVRLENTRKDMIVLREETDITKVNSRLAILKQQEEVINCETKLRTLLDSMTAFLLKLKKTTDNSTCEDLPMLSDHPMKTPSKSIVVSALLRHENQGEAQEWSPEDKFDRKVETGLFDLINDVTSVMDSIYKAAKEVASHYERENKQLKADKMTSQSRVEALKLELTNQIRSENNVEVSLRRRLEKVLKERDELRLKLFQNK